MYNSLLGVYGIKAMRREVGFVLGVLSYPRISSSVLRSATLLIEPFVSREYAFVRAIRGLG